MKTDALDRTIMERKTNEDNEGHEEVTPEGKMLVDSFVVIELIQ